MPGQYRRVPVFPLNLGRNDSSSPLALADGEAQDCQNVHFDDDAISPVGGAIKFGNQSAPKSALRTNVDPSLAGLQVAQSDLEGDTSSQSVPLRGYGYLPYNADQDIGGVKLVVSGHRSFQQGRNFEIKVSFQIPADEMLYEPDRRGSLAPDVGMGDAALEASETRYDEALDECFCILQKGGDRTAAMSWALAIVNLGATETINGTGIAATRPSNYALCFIWFDHPAYGLDVGTTPMRYDLSNPSNSNAGDYSTQAFRAVVVERFLTPGRTYHVAAALNLDTADVQNDTTWNDDGNFAVHLREDEGDLESFTHDSLSTVGLHVLKGPQDSLEYLVKYGIRYEGKDAMFVGLGFRMTAWKDLGFIPFGADACPLEHAGFQMVDRSTHTVNRGSGNTDLYPAGFHTLTGTKAANAFTVNHGGLTVGNTFGGREFFSGRFWSGLGNGTANYNSEALRGYRVVPMNNGTGIVGPNGLGAVYTVTGFSGTTSLQVTPDPSGNGDLSAMGHAILIYAFRWHQRPLIIGDVRIYSATRDYTDPRVLQSLISVVEFEDDLEPDKENLVGYWPFQDAGGGVLREMVRGVSGYRAPFETPTNRCGCRGERQLFLSGEGEALYLDVSENPVIARELEKNLSSGDGGFAIEMTLVIPEAYYGVPLGLPAMGGIIGRFAPYLASWEIRDPEGTGAATPPRPLMRFGHRLKVALGNEAAFQNPASFQLSVLEDTDQAGGEYPSTVPAWSGGANQWSDDAEWVGQTITLQFGVHPQGDELYDVYIAATPKDRLKPEAGDPRDAEMAVISSNVTVRRKDLLRSVIVIGGAWDPQQRDETNDDYPFGYQEMNARIILDEVRVFGAAAPGFLATVNSTGRGKLKGDNALPATELRTADIVRPLGGSVTTATVTEGSNTVDAPGNMRFYIAQSQDTIRAVERTYLVIAGDLFQLNNEETEPDFYRDAYWIEAVAADGTSLTLTTPYSDLSRANAAAGSFRLLGYTSFRDRIDQRPLTLGGGAGFRAGVSTVADAALSRQLFTNSSPVASLSFRGGERRAAWRIRVFSPLAAQASTLFRSQWVRGLSIPRWNPILGLHSLNETVYAAAQGALFRADDRWRRDGPTEELEHSLLVLSRMSRNGVWFPQAGDRIRCDTAADNVWPYATLALHDDQTWVFDAWVFSHSIEGIQTIAWLGTDAADPTAAPSATAPGQQLGWWFRLNNGRPELVLNSDRAGSVTTPEDGRYLATSLTAIPPNEWTHVRCYLEHENVGGSNVDAKIPVFKINGRSTTSAVNSQDTLAAPAGNWIRVTGKGGGIPASGAFMLLGCAFDFSRSFPEDDLFDIDAWFGENQHGRHRIGFLHSFNGRLGQVAIWRDDSSDPSVSGSPNFDPDQLTYTTTRFRVDLEEAIGHRVADSATDTTTSPTPCLVESHPLISLWHEFGAEARRVSFANSLDEIFCANGGRVVTLEGDQARPAGVLSPTVAPLFELERNPLWKANSDDPDLDNEPIGQASATADDRINHYRTLGRNFMSQEYHSEMEWDKDDSIPEHDWLTFKCLVKMGDVAGRIQLWGMRDSVENGKAIEIVDGKLRLIWFDQFLKKNVWIQTTGPVISAGSVHYIYLRKKWPPRDGVMGNWLDSVFGDSRLWRATFNAATGTLVPGDSVSWPGPSTGTVQRVFYDTASTGYIEVLRLTGTNPVSTNIVTDGADDVTLDENSYQPLYDSMVVRRFARSATRETEWDAKTDGSTRNAISFTTLEGTHANHTATGRVTPVGLFVDVAITTGIVTLGASDATGGTFHPDMVGMYLQTSSGTLYRIITYTSAVQVTVTDLDGSGPGAGEADVEAGVFVGTGLEQEEDFDNSDQPDDSIFDISFMGTAIQRNPTNGLVPFRGEVWDFAYNSNHFDNGADPDFFFDFSAVPLSDFIEGGTDDFVSSIFTATPPGGLEFSPAAANFTIVKSTQPNEELEIEQDDDASLSASSLFWNSLVSSGIFGGTRRVRVTFFDPRNNIESNPSPELLIIPEGEDKVNPSGETRIRLKGLPVSPDGEHIQRHIYFSPIDSIQLFRIQVIEDNTSSEVSIFPDEATITAGPPLRFDQAAPPEAAYVQFSQGAMWYGALRGDESAYVYSLPFRPHAVPLVNLSVLNSGSNAPITGMIEHAGAMLIFKRNAIWRVLIGQGALPVERRITFDGTGAVSDQSIQMLDDRVYFISNRGPALISSANRPEYLGDRMERFSNETLDPRTVDSTAAAINRKRNQYVWTAQRDSDEYARDCFSIEFDHALAGILPRIKAPALHRISRYRDPNLTALGEVDRREGGVRVMIGGTREGFIVYLDREDTTRMLMGPNQALWGNALITATGASTTTTIVTTDPVDVTQESVKGVPIRWRESNGTEREALGAWATESAGTTTIFLDKAATAAPAVSQVVAMGYVKHLWRTKAFDLDTPDLLKVWRFLDVLRDKEVDGSLRVRFFRDREAAATLEKTISLDRVIEEIEMRGIQAKVLEFEIDSQVPVLASGVAELDFDLVKVVLRVDETDIR